MHRQHGHATATAERGESRARDGTETKCTGTKNNKNAPAAPPGTAVRRQALRREGHWVCKAKQKGGKRAQRTKDNNTPENNERSATRKNTNARTKFKATIQKRRPQGNGPALILAPLVPHPIPLFVWVEEPLTLPSHHVRLHCPQIWRARPLAAPLPNFRTQLLQRRGQPQNTVQ